MTPQAVLKFRLGSFRAIGNSRAEPANLVHLGVARADVLQSGTSPGADADAARVRALAAYRDFVLHSGKTPTSLS
jgi:hypothetical protein